MLQFSILRTSIPEKSTSSSCFFLRSPGYFSSGVKTRFVGLSVDSFLRSGSTMECWEIVEALMFPAFLRLSLSLLMYESSPSSADKKLVPFRTSPNSRSRSLTTVTTETSTEVSQQCNSSQEPQNLNTSKPQNIKTSKTKTKNHKTKHQTAKVNSEIVLRK